MRPIPTSLEVFEAISNDLRAKLDLTDDQLRKVADAFAAVQTGQVSLLYLFLADILANLFPDTADLAANGGQLERLGNIYLNRQPNPATAGIYTVNVTGENGSVIRSGLTFKSNDDSRSPGILFITDAETVLTGAGDTIQIRSLTAGVDAILDVGNELTITEPVIGVEQIVDIATVVEEPRAAESIADYRQAVIDAIQLEPQGGARTDYILWSRDAQGVRKAYPFVKENDAGTTQVYVEATIDDSTDGNGTPSAQLLLDVEDVILLDPDVTKPIEERGRRPIQTELEVLPIVTIPVDVEIVGLNEDTTAIRATIQSNIESYLYTIRPFIAGADLARNKNDIIYAARLQSVISDVLDTSNFFTGFVLSVNGVDVNSFVFNRENIPYLRNLIYS